MIRVDSRKVNKGDIFVAIKGFAADGHDYIPQAVERGAVEIVCERAVEGVAVPQRVVKNARLEAARLAADFFGHPSERFKLIGVTGTNGKTTTTYMIKAILESRKAIVGLIGTNQNMIGDKVVPTERTTPESVELQELFAKMADEGCEYVVMEVSSHALVLDRVAYSGFEVGAFTNLTQDHLDFHADMEEYFNAKVKLLDMSRHVVVNVDDEWGRSIKGEVREVSGALAQNSKLTREGMEYVYKGELIKVAAVGGFNLQNTLLAIGVAEELGYTLQEIVSGLANFKGVCGRMELIPTNRDFSLIIDYAHTPDGLEKVLSAVKEFAKGRVVVVFGCGGDRDNTKRPIMGEIADRLADFCVITSDNPRTEEPSGIIEQIVAGMNDIAEKIIIQDRRAAIRYAIENAKKDDVVILAGKGHEDYQILPTGKIHFDEHEVVEEILREEEEERANGEDNHR